MMSLMDHNPNSALVMLRVELYSAARRLKGEHLEQFFDLLREVIMLDLSPTSGGMLAMRNQGKDEGGG